MKKHYIILLNLFFASVLLSQDVTYTLTGHRQEVIGSDTFHIADIISYSNAGFKLGSGQLYVNYDTTVFGPNVFFNNNLILTIPDSSILDKTIGAPLFNFNYYSDFVTNDNTFSRFSFSWQHQFSAACLDTSNIDYYSDVLFTIRLKRKPGFSGFDPGLCLESGINYIDQTYTACGPNPCNTNDCFNQPGTQLLTDYYPCNDCKIVYITANDGPGSLRDAINCANSGDTIRFSKSLKFDSIGLTTTQLELNKDLFLVAKENFQILVDGSGVDRVFNILSGNNVIIESISMIEGSGSIGSGINNEGNLLLKSLTIYSSGTAIDSTLNNINILNIEGVVRLKNN